MHSNGDIIASRELTHVPDGRRVTVKIFRPEAYADGHDFYCCYQILGIGDGKIRRAGGIDGIQAMVFALERAGADIWTSPEGRAGHLRWKGDETGGLGLPVPQSIRNLDHLK